MKYSMREFKFLNKNEITDYDGEMAREAVQFFTDFVGGNMGINIYEITTQIATYKISSTNYSQARLSGATMLVYPLDDTSVRITFYINVGAVTPYITEHRIEFDYQIQQR